MRRLALTSFALLAACGSRNGQGTSISFNSDDAAGNIVTEGHGSRASINIPGFSGTIKLPKVQMKADQIDLNGVHLYPGSTVTGFNVDTRGDGDDNGVLRISFDAPADPATVRDWFASHLNAASFRVHAQGSGLSGKTDDGKPFTLDLRPDGGSKSHGVITSG